MLLVGVFLFTSALPAQAAPAAHGDQEIHIDPMVLSRCGSQGVFFSGTMSRFPGEHTSFWPYENHSHRFHWTETEDSWQGGPYHYDVGTHTVRIELWRWNITNNLGDPSGLLVASDEYTFTVEPCPTPAPQPQSSSNDGGNGGGGGEEEPQPIVAKKKPQVKGATTVVKKGGFTNKLVPLIVEQNFAKVFGRKITHKESVYWKNRARTDKYTDILLVGTMTWHKLNWSTGPTKQSKTRHQE